MARAKSTMPYILAGLLVPGTVMFGARYIGQGPSISNAQVVAPALPEVVQFPEISLVNTMRLSSVQDDRGFESPFWFEDITLSEYTNPFEVPLDPKPSVDNLLPEIVVTAILPNAKNPMAVINSKPRRVGEEFDGGWQLIGIDGQNRTVILLHTSGARKVVALTKSRSPSRNPG